MATWSHTFHVFIAVDVQDDNRGQMLCSTVTVKLKQTNWIC